MTKEQLLLKAYLKMAKFIRDNPPNLDAILALPGGINVLAGGAQRDPEGREWANLFLYMALQEEKEKEKGKENNNDSE